MNNLKVTVILVANQPQQYAVTSGRWSVIAGKIQGPKIVRTFKRRASAEAFVAKAA